MTNEQCERIRREAIDRAHDGDRDDLSAVEQDAAFAVDCRAAGIDPTPSARQVWSAAFDQAYEDQLDDDC